MYMLHIHTNRYIVLIGLATINTKIDFSTLFRILYARGPNHYFTKIQIYYYTIMIY